MDFDFQNVNWSEFHFLRQSIAADRPEEYKCVFSNLPKMSNSLRLIGLATSDVSTSRARGDTLVCYTICSIHPRTGPESGHETAKALGQRETQEEKQAGRHLQALYPACRRSGGDPEAAAEYRSRDG